MQRFFILEDSTDRIEWFKHNLSHVTLDIATDISEVEKTWRPPYDALLLDHDLGGAIFVSSYNKNTGAEFCRWLSKRDDVDRRTTIIIHSHNPAGAATMASTLSESLFTSVECLPFGMLATHWSRGTIKMGGRYKFD
jgi:hypothetical protein